MKLIDYGGLLEYDSFPAMTAACSPHHNEACSTHCMKSWALHHEFAGHAMLGEFVCRADKGKCNGFDPSANLWVMCRAVFEELLSPVAFEHAGVDGAPISELLHGCLALHRRTRWSAKQILSSLHTMLKKNDGERCLKKAGIKLKRVYYDNSFKLKIGDAERAAPSHHASIDKTVKDARNALHDLQDKHHDLAASNRKNEAWAAPHKHSQTHVHHNAAGD